MPYEHINRADLNLLHTLFALLEERHVTRAARRCFLSQPATSRALERLREMFGDELLIRVGRQYERTARGERLLRDLESLLPRLELLLKGEQFDPAVTEERFRVSMTDHACVVLLPDLVRRTAGAAPKSRLEVVPWSDARFEDVEAGRVDLVLDVAGAPSSLNSEVLFADVFACVIAASHPLRARRFTLRQDHCGHAGRHPGNLRAEHGVFWLWPGEREGPAHSQLSARRRSCRHLQPRNLSGSVSGDVKRRDHRDATGLSLQLGRGLSPDEESRRGSSALHGDGGLCDQIAKADAH